MGELGLHELEDVLLECRRGINSLHARQLRVMAEIALRFGGEYQSEQVGLSLKWSPNWAADRVDPAEKVVARLPASLGALERGEIDLYKVQTVHELTMNLSPEHARGRGSGAGAGVGADRCADAATRPADRDAGGPAWCAAEAKAQRCVGLESEDDGMAKPFAYVPADKAVAIKLRVDKIARLVRTPRDDRTMGQRRADVVWDLLLGTPGNVQVQLQATVPAAMLMRVDDQPGELAGYGPITPDRPPAALRDFVQARDKTCVFPGCSVPAHRADIDHTMAFPEGPTAPENLGVMCRAHHRLKQDRRWMVLQPSPGRFEWTTPSNRTYTRDPVAA